MSKKIPKQQAKDKINTAALACAEARHLWAAAASALNGTLRINKDGIFQDRDALHCMMRIAQANLDKAKELLDAVDWPTGTDYDQLEQEHNGTTMLITDVRHFLDDKGAIGPQSGPGRQLADFLGSVIAAATTAAELGTQALCNKCKKQVSSEISEQGEIYWRCTCCAEAGVVRNWRGTLWDLSNDPGNAN